MILTEAQDNKVLVLAKGSINLVVEPDRPSPWRRVRSFAGAIAASSLAGAAVAALTVFIVEQRIERGLEARLTARIESLDADLNAVLASAGDQSEQRSDRLLAHVDQIGGKVGQVGKRVDDIGNSVDLLPGAFDKALQGGTKSLVGWVSAVRAARAAAGAPSLTVHPPERRRKSP